MAYAWCDHHFRSYEHLGSCYKLFCEERKWECILCLFAEKHEGRCDALFALLKRWIGDAVRKPGTLIEDLAGLAAGSRKATEEHQKRYPSGAKSRIVELCPNQKPEVS